MLDKIYNSDPGQAISPVKILVIGACGRVGTELTKALRARYGVQQVIASDRHGPVRGLKNYRQLNVLERSALERTVSKNDITQIYLLADMLSAGGGKDSNASWRLNTQALISVLEIARDHQLDKVFWPSSIAVFGPASAKYNCRQHDRTEPDTVYGISKKAGEHWCNYYFDKYGVDIRSLRFPVLISRTVSPGDIAGYAADVYHHALELQRYTCFLEEDCCLPMVYIPDAVRAIIALMDAPKEQIKIRTSYNVAAMSFAPCDLAAAIKAKIPAFTIRYEPDSRQAIAQSWPACIDDREAREDWGWKPAFSLQTMTADMLRRLCEQKGIAIEKLVEEIQVEFYPHETC